MKTNKPMGMIELGYEVLVMPLDAAHKIQAILAEHAIKVDRVYCNNANPTVYVQKPYDAPPVQVAKAPDYDASAIKETVYSQWRSVISQRDKDAPIMNPNDFAKLQGE